MAEKEYQRLTRSCRRSAVGVITVARASLWLGKDHLLCVETTGYTESYKRFYFRDIQAISTRETNVRKVWLFVWGGLAALFVFIGIIANDNAALITFLCLAGLSGLAVVINLALGPTCACQIRTAVQTEQLPVLRVRRARKLLDRIRPFIAEAQGQLTAEEIPARMQELASAGPDPAAAAAPETLRYVIDDLNLPPRIVS